MSRRLYATLAAAGLVAAGALSFSAHALDANETLPKDGCVDFADPDGPDDGRTGSHNGVPQVGLPNDGDLDILGVAVHTSPDRLKFFVSVKDLKASPTVGIGHQFEVAFTALGKGVRMIESSYANATLTDQFGGHKLLIGTQNNTSVPLDTFENATKNYVIFSVDREALGTALGGTIDDGTELTPFSSQSSVTFTGDNTQVADIAAAPKDKTYKVGAEICFPPPPSTLTAGTAVAAQFTDAGTVSATLTVGEDTLDGRDVTFTLGSKSVTVKTDEEGVATAAFNPGVPAGTYQVTASFAGDTTGAPSTVQIPFTVRAETTKTTVTSTASGTKRTVTAKLVDDDNHAVAGQTIVWYVNGAKAGTGKTSAAGTAVLTTAKPGQTVQAQFAGVAGKYAASKASKKV